MNTKRLITASIFSLISASTALAADVMIPHQPASSTASTIVAPTFSWTGLYLGVQAGGFSSKADMALVGQEKSLPLDKEFSPKLSGFAGGFYAGSNIDLGDNFIFGIDTDLMVSGKKHTKTITIGAADNATVENAVVRSRRSASLQTPQAPQAATSEETQRIASGTAGAGATTGGTLTAVSASEKSAGTRSSQAPAKPVTAIQPSRAGAAQSNQAATTGDSSNVNATQTVAVEVKNPGVSTISSQTPAASPVAQSASSRQTVRLVQLPSSSLGRSNTGGTSVGVVSRSQPVASKSSSPDAGGRTPERSASLSLARSAIGGQLSGGRASEGTVSEKPVAIKTASSTSSTVSGASQPAVKAPTLVQPVSQPSAAEKTVPSSSLVLARSGSSNGSETKVSNGINGAQQGGHHSSSHSSGNANAHGAPHAGGHSSGAHPNGTNPHASRSHGGQNMSGHGAQSTQA
ncbi:porin family protein, partial [Bartonella sp. AP57NXGY]|uniref:porin family protein n=1 Tax=Bartonella sp. AP57NXGY TaxID=3243497 RepID=UPI0035D0A3FF